MILGTIHPAGCYSAMHTFFEQHLLIFGLIIFAIFLIEVRSVAGIILMKYRQTERSVLPESWPIFLIFPSSNNFIPTR